MKKLLFSFILGLLMISFVEASAIKDVQFIINGQTVDIEGNGYVNLKTGSSNTITIIFTSMENIEDVAFIAHIIGLSSTAYTERFDILEESRYSKTLKLYIPKDVDVREEWILTTNIETPLEVIWSHDFKAIMHSSLQYI